MTAAVLSLSILSIYYFDSYSGAYDDAVYKLETEGNVYNLKHPKQRWDLPRELEEISGLSFYKKNKLACIQDEDGILFIYDLHKKEISEQFKFGDPGDYEGVEMIDKTAYVLKSNGHVYYFKLPHSENATKIKTDLSKKNDTEGLGFHEDMMDLLIACKEGPGTKKVELKKCRSIYRIDLEESKFKKNPKFVIKGKAYNEMIEQKGLSKKKHTPFKPSGVAVHPKTKDIYVIGTVGKMMVIIDPEGKIKDLIPLDPKIFYVLQLTDYRNENATVIPTKIIQNDDVGPFVFKIIDNGAGKKAEKFHIETGASYRSMTEVFKGLTKGEQVIDQGFRELSNGMAVKIADKES